jgi:hypothetical protein
MAVVKYYRDGRAWDADLLSSPQWPQVEEAIARMDNYCFPIVLLSRLDFESGADVFGDEDAFNVVGGNGRYALFHMTGDWQYVDPDGGAGEVRLWESDQGYFCQERNVVTDLQEVLRIVHRYYETGSFSGLSEQT